MVTISSDRQTEYARHLLKIAAPPQCRMFAWMSERTARQRFARCKLDSTHEKWCSISRESSFFGWVFHNVFGWAIGHHQNDLPLRVRHSSRAAPASTRSTRRGAARSRSGLQYSTSHSAQIVTRAVTLEVVESSRLIKPTGTFYAGIYRIFEYKRIRIFEFGYTEQ